MGPLARLLILVAAFPAAACEYPDEGNMPLRRAVSRVLYLPETEAWAEHVHRTGAVVNYAVRLDEPFHAGDRCYWPVDVETGTRRWQRFFVTPDGRNVLVRGDNGATLTLDQWRGKSPRPSG